MKQYTITAISFILALVVAAPAWGSTVQVTVVGNDGASISGAEVNVAFLGYSGAEDRIVKATEDEGRYTATGTAALRINVAVEKDGYYRSYIERLSRKKDHDLTVVLREKRNPRALYAKRTRILVPEQSQDLGYDLEKGDWVAPLGKGRSADVIFQVNYQKQDFWTYDYRLTVSFPNIGDGIQKCSRNKYSALKMSHLAPENGYEPRWIQTESREGKDAQIKCNTDFYRGHWMRVRTLLDDKGNVVSANYVKIYGDFPDMHYYFNPTPNDRNLEFDPAQNLFDSLEPDERVSDP